MRTLLAAALLVLAACAQKPPGRCASDAECGAGSVCTNGVCAGCDTNADCREWQACAGTSHACVSSPGRCTRSSECLQWELCDGTGHVCVLAPGLCADATDCAAYEDCSAGHRCAVQPGRCTTAADCAGFSPSCDAGNRCSDNPPDGNDILIWGTLGEGACYLDAIAPVISPSQAKVGFDCYSEVSSFTTPAVRDPTGTLVYIDGARSPERPVRFVPDSWIWDPVFNSWDYPSDGNLDDPAMPASACVSTDAVENFVLQETTGSYAYACALARNEWYDADGSPFVSGAQLKAWNESDVLLGTDGSYAATTWYVWDPGTRARHAVTGLPSTFTFLDARANHGGFWMALIPSGGAVGQLWSISGAGVATKVTDYGPKPAIAPTSYYGVIDRKGALYVEGMDQTVVFNDLIVKYPADGSPGTVIYKESDAPADANSSPSHLWVFFHISYLFHGP